MLGNHKIFFFFWRTNLSGTILDRTILGVFSLFFFFFLVASCLAYFTWTYPKDLVPFLTVVRPQGSFLAQFSLNFQRIWAFLTFKPTVVAFFYDLILSHLFLWRSWAFNRWLPAENIIGYWPKKNSSNSFNLKLKILKIIIFVKIYLLE